MAHLPPPLFNVVPLATMFVGTRKRPNNVEEEGGGGSGYLKTPLFRKVSKQFCRRLQVNTAYPKRTRRHTLPSRCINFKDKKSLIFDFILSLSLSQLRAIIADMNHIGKNINTASSSTGDSPRIDFGSIIFLNLHQ